MAVDYPDAGAAVATAAAPAPAGLAVEVFTGAVEMMDITAEASMSMDWAQDEQQPPPMPYTQQQQPTPMPYTQQQQPSMANIQQQPHPMTLPQLLPRTSQQQATNLQHQLPMYVPQLSMQHRLSRTTPQLPGSQQQPAAMALLQPLPRTSQQQATNLQHQLPGAPLSNQDRLSRIARAAWATAAQVPTPMNDTTPLGMMTTQQAANEWRAVTAAAAEGRPRRALRARRNRGAGEQEEWVVQWQEAQNRARMQNRPGGVQQREREAAAL